MGVNKYDKVCCLGFAFRRGTKRIFDSCTYGQFEPHRKKTGCLPMRKQKRRSASQSAFVFAIRTVSLLLKSEISSF